MSNLQIFNYNGVNGLRAIVVNDEPWFVAKDACDLLELGDVSKAVSRLDDDEKGTNSIPTLGGSQEMLCVNEPGLYSLILSSRKPESKQLKRWVTHDVLPSIRKHGAYMTPATIEQAIMNPDTIIQLATKLKDEMAKRQHLEIENAQKQQIIYELQPKATYYDLILQNKSLLSMTKIAKDYGMSAVSMNSLLHELGIQFKQGDVWLLYSKYADKGYTQSKTHAIDDERNKFHTYWTQKGRLFIYELLKQKKDLLPLIERQQIKEAK